MKRRIDAWDVLFFIGTWLIAAGFWYVWPPLVYFWIGLVLIAFAVLGAKR